MLLPAAWLGYAGSRRRHHLFWLLINLVIVPPAILAAILPGPNVLGYWFAYRALMHWVAWLGARRPRHLKRTTNFLPTPELDEPINAADAAQALGAELHDVHIAEPSLETLFLHHTGRSLRD